MNLVFDTSVLVAAVRDAHSHHERARPWIRAVASGRIDAAISLHAAAETWSVLTRLPGSLQLPPAMATLVVDRLLEQFQPIAMSEAIYRRAMVRCAERGSRSGALFDALHLVAAESVGALGLVTFNRADFERLRAEDSPEILVPPDPPDFDL